MKTLLTLMVATMFSFSMPTEKPLTIVKSTPSTLAQFPGGNQAFFQYITQYLNYPDIAKENCIEGQVIISIEIEANGKIKNTKVLKGIGFGCDKEAIRVVQNMPKWIPAKRLGNPIASKIVIPIKFRLI